MLPPGEAKHSYQKVVRRDTDVAFKTNQERIDTHMGFTINTNISASVAASNLNHSNNLLQKSLARLSSGSKITTPSDDAGGLAVSMKLEAAISRTDSTTTNVANAVSFLQTMDSGLKSAGDVLNRIAELNTLYGDVTKSDSDKANYTKEFTALAAQLTSIAAGTFNGVDLFGGGTLAVGLSEDGVQTMDITQADLATAVAGVTTIDGTSTTTTAIKDAIDLVAGARAQNGAETSRLSFSADLLATSRTNLEAANSRIVDTDVALESTRLARNSILVQAGSAMLAQANAASQSVLRLLQ
jgi:flagellin